MHEDLELFFVVGEGAVEVTIGSTPHVVIFDEPSELAVGEVIVEAPSLQLPTYRAGAFAVGQSLVHAGETYRVRQRLKEPLDGALTRIVLAKG